MKKSSTINELHKKCTGILLLLFCLISMATFAAKPAHIAAFPLQTVGGIVKDQNGNSLPGVSIKVKDKPVGTVTDTAGKFKLMVPDGSHIIVIRLIGYVSQQIDITGSSSFHITLIEDVSKLNEIVVVGYGSQSREKLTTAVAKLDTRVLHDVPYTNIGNALEGNISGLQVQTVSGQPGTAPRIILRGGTSINNPNGATALYIIDGIIRPNGLTDINAADVESIQVLKDAAATAIYGARGSNGVIIVTTKRGKADKTVISYIFNGSSATAQRLPVYANTHDYIYWNRIGTQAAAVKNPALAARLTQGNASGTGNDLTNKTAFTTQYLTPANQYKLNEGWQSLQDPIDPTKTIIYKDTNFSDLIYRTGVSNDHYLDVTGGTDKATFYAGLGYTNSNGIALVTNYKRLSFNLNGSYKIKDNLKVNAGVLYSNRTQNAVASFANVFYRSASLPGSAKYQFEDGTIAPGGQNSSIGNPDYFYKGQYAPQGDSGVEDLAINLGLKWDIVPGLSFEPYLSLLREGSYSYTFQPAAYLNGLTNPLVTLRNATQADNVTRQYQGDAILTYLHTFASKHNLEVKVGYSHYSRNQRNFNAAGQNAATDLIPTLNGSALPTVVNGTNSTLLLDGGFYRANYDYEGKYLVSFTGRFDGASNLGENHKFGFFPGVSIGWNMDKEKFWQQHDQHDFMQLKLRGSYGVNGNISGLGDFQAEGSFTTSDLYGGQASIRQGIIPNSNLKWEQSKTFDVGTDIGLFNHKVGLIFDYYNRRTDDLITSVSLPASTGFSTILTNLGSLQTRGYEIEINADMLPGKSSLKWTLSVNAAHTSRKILKLPSNGIANNRQGGVLVYDPAVGDYVWRGGLQEGGRLGDMFGYKYLGVYATDADAAKAPVDNGITVTNKTKFGGDAIFADLDNNGILDSRDQVYAGNPYPTWTGGFNNYFSYKQFSLSIRTDFTAGATLFNYPAYFGNGQLQGDALPLQSYFDNMWKKQGDNAKLPRYVWQSITGNFRTSTMVYEKADFLCLRAISFGYTLPQSLVRRAGMNSARVTISGTNLYYFTSYSGPVPEGGGTDTNGDAGGRYPIPRTFSLGLNMTF
jgi:TonB-linked SusC/RagA family outer membrane protein